MNQKEQIDILLMKLFNEQENHIFKFVEDSQCGMNKALLYIYFHNEPLCAQDLGNSLDISMARTTVLIQKLEKKRLIVKEISPKDHRKTYIKLTLEGIKEIEKLKTKTYMMASLLVDKIGFEKLYTFLDILKEINQTFEENKEEKHVKIS